MSKDNENKPRGNAVGEPKRSVAERREANPASVDSYLEINRNVVDELPPPIEVNYLLQACGCKSWYCQDCCLNLGLKIRCKLVRTLETFQSLQMWTLTIDPLLFQTPQAAFKYVRKKRSISELARALSKKGYLISKRYFYVVEWQKKTEMPHWHVLYETKHIPFEYLCTVWNRNRPKELSAPVGNRPGFGSVRFSAPAFTDAKHAANYATKYLIKHPDHGYPAWVLDSLGHVPRYGTSRGFWGQTNAKQNVRLQADKTNLPSPQSRKKTIRERIDSCKNDCVVLVNYSWSTSDGDKNNATRFVASVPTTFEDAKKKLNPFQQINVARYNISQREASDLAEIKLHKHESHKFENPNPTSPSNIKEDVE